MENTSFLEKEYPGAPLDPDLIRKCIEHRRKYGPPPPWLPNGEERFFKLLTGKPLEYNYSDDNPTIVEDPFVEYGKTRMTIEEYLEWEKSNVEKHEYYRGEVFAMAGASIAHNIICANLMGILSPKLKRSPCRPCNSDQCIHVPGNTLFAYPDLSIICGKPVTLEIDENTVLNPSILIEVLSPSTKHYNRNGKFRRYKQIRTLTEYVLADSEKWSVEVFRLKKNDEWTVEKYDRQDSVLYLKTIALSIPVESIYEGTGLSGTKNHIG